ncbi:hypothetical protein POM88_051987 [Heracleum sosnowskyi]|uniref:Uncharacterized protein n=1 Tax=Heracleum sosnowskyi TaxID=360622 RepID=A0AAD8GSM9_9APIA|nr:hypothetical protein POM88_051987 [Heracleum sosnowskyi]
MFCSVLKNAKLPHGCASNISRYVHTKERKVSGYKSHDAHFILHYLLPFAVKKSLKPEVAVPFIRLSAFLRAKKQVKRKYVTAHHLQQQQRKKKPVHVEEAEKISTRKSPRLNKLQANTDATVTNRPASARRKLDLQDISHEDEHMGENDHIEDDLPPPPPPPPLTPADKKIVMRLKDYEKHMTDYEKQRAINVKKKQ